MVEAFRDSLDQERAGFGLKGLRQRLRRQKSNGGSDPEPRRHALSFSRIAATRNQPEGYRAITIE
jgi:hypothetical protein